VLFDPHTDLPLSSFGKARDDVDWLVSLLAEEGLSVDPGSSLSQALEAARHLVDAVPGRRPPANLPQVLSAAFLARALRLAHSNPSFRNLRSLLPHLVSINSDPLPAVSAASTQPRNVVFELLIGSCFLAAGISASAAKPDLVLDHGGRWNIAVKAIYSPNPVSLMDRGAEGAKAGARRSRLLCPRGRRRQQPTFAPRVSAPSQAF
jgi:hypothetical protein